MHQFWPILYCYLWLNKPPLLARGHWSVHLKKLGFWKRRKGAHARHLTWKREGARFFYVDKTASKSSARAPSFYPRRLGNSLANSKISYKLLSFPNRRIKVLQIFLTLWQKKPSKWGVGGHLMSPVKPILERLSAWQGPARTWEIGNLIRFGRWRF